MRANLHAVHDDDLEALLTKLKQGQIKCKFTQEIITLENLHSIFPEEKTIKLVCDSPEAIKLLSEYINDKNL
jgi:ribosomal protein L29